MTEHIRNIILHPGECRTADASCRITTLLGSCVSITLWHPGLRIGAMSHFLLASRNRRHIGKLDGRYGDEAVLIMLEQLVQHRVIPEECEAKIFGGGNMFPDRYGPGVTQVGRRNGDAARLMLKGLGFHITSEHLFGVGHRKIVFDIASGIVWSRQHGVSVPAQTF